MKNEIKLCMFFYDRTVPRPFADRPEVLKEIYQICGPGLQMVRVNGRPMLCRADDMTLEGKKIEEISALPFSLITEEVLHSPLVESVQNQRQNLKREKLLSTSEKEKLKSVPYFSAAHSESVGIIALSDQKIGVDIEPQMREPGPLARSFTPEEQFYCKQHAGERPAPEIVIFTRKEAIMKASAEATYSHYKKIETVKNGQLQSLVEGFVLSSFCRGTYFITVAGAGDIQLVEKKIFFIS